MKNTIQNLITPLVGLFAFLVPTAGAYYLGAAWINWITPDFQRTGVLNWTVISWIAGILVLLFAALVLSISYMIGKSLMEAIS